jgi:hypothetical protein
MKKHTIVHDGDLAVINALKMVFGERLGHLLCCLHFKDNIKNHLRFKLQVDKEITDIILRDFGGTFRENGILDSTSEEVKENIEMFYSKWYFKYFKYFKCFK